LRILSAYLMTIATTCRGVWPRVTPARPPVVRAACRRCSAYHPSHRVDRDHRADLDSRRGLRHMGATDTRRARGATDAPRTPSSGHPAGGRAGGRADGRAAHHAVVAVEEALAANLGAALGERGDKAEEQREEGEEEVPQPDLPTAPGQCRPAGVGVGCTPAGALRSRGAAAVKTGGPRRAGRRSSP
jgi:hypothetical protein